MTPRSMVIRPIRHNCYHKYQISSIPNHNIHPHPSKLSKSTSTASQYHQQFAIPIRILPSNDILSIKFISNHSSPTRTWKITHSWNGKEAKLTMKKLQIHKIKINENERMSFIGNFTHIETISFIASEQKNEKLKKKEKRQILYVVHTRCWKNVWSVDKTWYEL